MSIKAQIERISGEVDTQRNLIDQILIALQGRVPGGDNDDNTTAALDSAVLGEMILM